ncbi:MAG: hypothetical protein J5970_02865 [Bacilli bacterium]|nr:hypothetical protein [Bacilli bacterium]
METKVFYHGGVPADFNINNIDIYRLATKQGKQDRNYAGFYMFDENRRDGAFHYAEQTNSVENTTDRGVVRIEMDSNLNIKTLDRMFEIDRISQEQLQEYRNQEYDLVSGRSFDGQQYVLLNKDKIKNISFESMDKRYSEEPKQEVEVKEEQMQDEYMTLDELESILSESGYMCLGHGTGRKGNDDEIVDSIFSEGLRTKNNSLALTTIGLSTPTQELKQQYAEYGIPEPTMDGLKEQLNNWQHLDSQKIILARVPTEYINQMGDRSDLDGEMYGAFMVEEIQSNGKTTNYLDPRYIIGCYDVEKKAVRMNPCFERTLTNQTISTLQSKYKKALDKTKQRLARAEQEMFSPVQEQQVDDIVEQMATGQYDENGFPILSSESIKNEQQLDKGKVYVKTKGFAQVGILGIIAIIVSIGIVILGVILER